MMDVISKITIYALKINLYKNIIPRKHRGTCLRRPVVYGQAVDTTFRMPIYTMLNQRNANPMIPNPGI